MENVGQFDLRRWRCGFQGLERILGATCEFSSAVEVLVSGQLWRQGKGLSVDAAQEKEVPCVPLSILRRVAADAFVTGWRKPTPGFAH